MSAREVGKVGVNFDDTPERNEHRNADALSETERTNWFAARRKIRQRIGEDDATIEEFEQRMRAAHPEMPAMEPSEDELSVSDTAAITVSVGWLAWVIRQFPTQPGEGAQRPEDKP